jgi:hypothetical protein
MRSAVGPGPMRPPSGRSPATSAPRERWDGEIAGWNVIVFDDVDGRHPGISPESPDIHLVTETIANLAGY